MKATLILENGSVFRGESIGAVGERMCEMVFNTSMAGHQDILSDPSYAGQGVVLSYPLIGNVGVNGEDNQSERPWVEAVVVRHLSPRGSNFRCEGTLDDYLKQHDIVGISGVDTRALTRILRSQGAMNGMITCAEHFHVDQVVERLKAHRVSGGVARVSRRAAETLEPAGDAVCHVAVLDYGVSRQVLDSLLRRGCRVTVLPADSAARSVLAGGYHGVLLSPGPGDPAACADLVEEVKELYRSELPLLGIGLGHQLLALATGARVSRLSYGHRGANVPVRDLEKGRVFITAQNHGYVVEGDSIDPQVAQVSHVNVNDATVEGLCYRRPNCFSLQFHPEANGGPGETEYLFDRFVSCMGGEG